MAAEITFDRVLWAHSDGVLSVNNSSIQWRSKSTEAIKKMHKEDIVNVMYSQVGGKRCILKVFQRGGNVLRFDGLGIDDIKTLSEYVESHFNRKVQLQNVSTVGGNWGEMVFEGNNLNFQINDTSILEIPVDNIAQCAVPMKNEVELQFHEDDTVAGDEETLVEMRLYVPPGDGEDPAAETFKQDVLTKANISKIAGQSIVELDETIGTFLTPRGRYAIEMYGKFMRMHGKTYDYKIMYSNINRCFLLERPDGISTAFVISLEEPIRQGKQGYPHLVLQLRKEDRDIDVNLPPEELETYKGSLAERMSGQLPQLVATLFKYLLKKKVYTSGKFKTHNEDRAVKCALKAQEGLLYPLEKSFMFIHKPTTFIRYEEVDYVEFQRYSGQSGSAASRNFDLLVKCKRYGGEAPREYMFSAIDRREFPELFQFLGNKKLKVRALKESVPDSAVMSSLGPEEGEIDEEGSEEDSDFGPGNSESSEDDYSEGSDAEGDEDEEKPKKRKGKGKEKASKKMKKSDESDEEESD